MPTIYGLPSDGSIPRVLDPLKWESSRAFDVTAPPRVEDRPVVQFAQDMATKLTAPVEYKLKGVGGGSKVTSWDGQDDPTFRLWPGEYETFNGGAADLHLIGKIKPGGGSQSAGWPVVIEFDTNSHVVEIATYGTTAGWSLTIEVNGRMVDDTMLRGQNLTSSATCTLTFPDNGATRRIRVATTYRPGFNSVRVLTGKTVTKPTDAQLTGAIIGDSFVNGSGNSHIYPDQGAELLETFAPRLLRMLGYDRQILAGIGGTGWTTANPFSERVPFVVGKAPDLLLFYGSRNDGANPAGLQQTIEDTLALVPETTRTVLIPPNRPGHDGNYLQVVAAAEASGVDVIKWDGIIHGTGRIGTPTGDGPADYFRMVDGAHPTLDAHRAMARILYGKLVELLY